MFPLNVLLIRRETPKAFQLHLIAPDGSVSGPFVWVPKSQMVDPDKYKAGDMNVTIRVAAWIMEKIQRSPEGRNP